MQRCYDTHWPFMGICSFASVLMPHQHPQKEITAEMAYEGVNNYCHKTFDWTPAEEDSTTMYVEMGEETDSAYQVVFRSYTAALTFFYVNKTSGITKMVEYVPGLEIREEAGTINLFDYLK